MFAYKEKQSSAGFYLTLCQGIESKESVRSKDIVGM